MHSTQPTTGERSHLPGGTQHAVGNIYPLLGSVALHPTYYYYWRAIAPTWGNPTRCGKHIPVVGFRCTPPNLLLESDRTYLGEPNTLWETYTRCWVPLHSTQPTTGERSHLPGGTQHPLGKHIPVVGFRCTPPNLLLESDRTYLGEPNTLWETYTRCWVPLHSTQPTTGERSHLPGGTQHAVGNIYPLLGSVALHPTYYWRAIAPTWGNPTPPGETYTRCWVPLHSTQPTTGERSHLPGGTQHPLGKHIPVVGFRCTPPNLLLESDRTYLGEPNTPWGNIYPLLGSVALHPTYYWRAIAPTWGNPTPPGETYTRCWVPLHSTQPTTGERSHLPGGTQHPLGKHIPLSSAKKPGFSQKSGFSEPPWGNPTRCG
ncbi:hypothetical protein [Limnospira fusiformis]|uniref:hypothetical protein n=1 Tax=Limnospira fusiformis TaxID=54297 RepID=UPI001873E40B